MQPTPRSPLLVLGAVLGTLALVVTGWLLGHGGTTTPAAVAATGSTDGSGDRARDGVLVSGTGEVTGRPDTLVARFGTEATASTVDDALARADRALGRITDALKKGGVDAADLQTAGLDIYPQYSNDGRQVTGYQAQQQLTVTFRDVDAAGRLIGRAVSAGGDAARLSGLSFRIDDDSALLADARRKAFDDAKAKADLYGDAAGRGLGRVVSVTETVTGNDTPYPMGQYYAARDSAAGADVNIEAGQQQLSVTVTVEWSFD
jgi:uncharacterized protein YggE